MTAPQPDCPKLLSLAVHELRTPVSVASGYLRMLLQFHGQSLAPDQKKYVTEAAQSCSRLGDLLVDLSSLSKLLSEQLEFKRETIAIFSLAEEVAASIAEGLSGGGRLELRGADRSTMVEGDRGWLLVAIRSLLAATVREQPRPGLLILQCRRVTTGRERRAVMAFGEPDAAAALASLPPNRWGPFDQWRGGVGFTMPIAAAVVAAHRGRLGSLAGAARRAAVAFALPLVG